MHKLNQYFARKLIMTACSHVNLERSKTGKQVNQYSRTDQYCIQKKRVADCKNTLNVLTAGGDTPLSIKVKSLEGNCDNTALEKDPPLEKQQRRQKI